MTAGKPRFLIIAGMHRSGTSAADLLVQPGRPDRFNDYRLP